MTTSPLPADRFTDLFGETRGGHGDLLDDVAELAGSAQLTDTEALLSRHLLDSGWMRYLREDGWRRPGSFYGWSKASHVRYDGDEPLDGSLYTTSEAIADQVAEEKLVMQGWLFDGAEWVHANPPAQAARSGRRFAYPDVKRARDCEAYFQRCRDAEV